jgi:hypothetical protein
LEITLPPDILAQTADVARRYAETWFQGARAKREIARETLEAMARRELNGKRVGVMRSQGALVVHAQAVDVFVAAVQETVDDLRVLEPAPQPRVCFSAEERLYLRRAGLDGAIDDVKTLAAKECLILKANRVLIDMENAMIDGENARNSNDKRRARQRKVSALRELYGDSCSLCDLQIWFDAPFEVRDGIVEQRHACAPTVDRLVPRRDRRSRDLANLRLSHRWCHRYALNHPGDHPSNDPRYHAMVVEPMKQLT